MKKLKWCGWYVKLSCSLIIQIINSWLECLPPVIASACPGVYKFKSRSPSCRTITIRFRSEKSTPGFKLISLLMNFSIFVKPASGNTSIARLNIGLWGSKFCNCTKWKDRGTFRNACWKYIRATKFWLKCDDFNWCNLEFLFCQIHFLNTYFSR